MRLKIRKYPIYWSAILLFILLISCKNTGKNIKGDNDQISGDYRVAIELIFEETGIEDSLLDDLTGSEFECYQWSNHVVLFGEAKDTSVVFELIHQKYTDVQIKHYDDPFYVFDRAIHCSDSTIQKPWKDYLLTANLVADSVLQQEYMEYHRTQFEEWPEVAQGFCNADFQQLLVFRNGRQLLLVISIPADKMLDELNPKTEENNPRVVEWNRRMSKYQEGIAGTDPGETWVFLEKVEYDAGNNQ